eukprot:5645521-Lingulodinium_polyedra.AAC.1
MDTSDGQDQGQARRNVLGVFVDAERRRHLLLQEKAAQVGVHGVPRRPGAGTPRLQHHGLAR